MIIDPLNRFQKYPPTRGAQCLEWPMAPITIEFAISNSLWSCNYLKLPVIPIESSESQKIWSQKVRSEVVNLINILIFRIHCLFANLGFCNVLLSAGFFIYTFLIDIYYDVDSFNTLLNLNAGTSKYGVWPLAKVNIGFKISSFLTFKFVANDPYWNGG